MNNNQKTLLKENNKYIETKIDILLENKKKNNLLYEESNKKLIEMKFNHYKNCKHEEDKTFIIEQINNQNENLELENINDDNFNSIFSEDNIDIKKERKNIELYKYTTKINKNDFNGVTENFHNTNNEFDNINKYTISDIDNLKKK